MKRQHAAWTAILLVAMLWTATAQNGAVTGTVTDALTGESLPGVHIRVLEPENGRFIGGAYTDAAGTFRMDGISAGTWRIVTSCLGYETDSREIRVGASAPVTLDIALKENIIDLEEVVVTASRRKEKVLDAPASVSVITARDIAARNALTPIDHLQGVQGVDVAQKGVLQREYAARGLNNIFNGTIRTLVDNRMTNLPSLRANVSYLQSITDADIDRVEVVLGPGSALYGPNVTNGVMNIITKSPFASRGTDVSIMGGNQALMSATARHAGTLGGSFGYRLSAGYMSAEDWTYTDPREPYPDDSDPERYMVDARLDYMLGQNSSVILNAGQSTAVRGLDLTDNGAVLADNFRYSHVQGRFISGDFFAQVYLNVNDAGNTYLLRENQKIVDNSKKIVAEVQHSSAPADWERLTYGVDMYLTRPETDGTIMGRNEDNDDVNEFGAYLQSDTRLVGDMLGLILAGRVDYHSVLEDPVFSPRAGVRFSPSHNHSFRATYNRAYQTPVISDLFLDLPITDDVFGIGIPPLTYGLRNVGVPESGYTFERPGGDLLFHSNFNPDPAMGLGVGQAAAYWDAVVQVVSASPDLPEDARQLLAMIPAPDAAQVGGTLAALNIETEDFDPIDPSAVQDIEALTPTRLQSMEIGYKGMLSDRIQLGLDVYHSEYENFTTPARVITPNVFLNGEQTAAYLYANASPVIGEEAAQQFAALVAGGMAQVPVGTVTPAQAASRTELLMAPINYGTIDYWGADVSLRAGLLSNLNISGSYSWISTVYFDDVEGKGPLSLNVPKHKASLALQYTEPASGIQGTVRYRFNNGFRLKSGVYEGRIDAHSLVDLAVRAPLPLPLRPDFVLSVQNILDHRHVQYIGGAEIGRLITGRLQLHF